MIALRLAFLLVFLGSAVAAPAQLAYKLEADDRETLPGVPISLRLVVTNNGTTEIRVPVAVYFHAARDGAEAFVGQEWTPWKKPRPDSAEEWDYRVALAAGASLSGDYPLSPGCMGPALMHWFVFQPGRYTLRVITSPGRNDLRHVIENASLADVLKAVPDLIVSTPLMLEVRQPEGVDAEAWKHVLEVSNGDGWGYASHGFGPDIQMRIARELRQKFPASRYAHCFGAAHMRDESLASLESFATRLRAVTPRPPMLDWKELEIASRYGSDCLGHLRAPRNAAAAVEACETARTLLRTLAATTTNSDVRKGAEGELRGTMTADVVRNWAQLRDAKDAGTLQRVRPFIQCVKETGKSLEVRYGYENPNPFYVVAGLGFGNFFAPGPENRNQPLRFLPGRHENVFTVDIEGKKTDPNRTIAWTLQGTTVSAPAESVPRCKGQ